jgi:hypothetical protein
VECQKNEKKNRKNNGDPKLNGRDTNKEQNGTYLSERMFSYKISGIALKS